MEPAVPWPALRFDPELPVGSLGLSVALVSLVVLAAAVAWPQTAETLLRTLLAGLALAFVGARAYGAALPERTTHDAYSPFEGQPAERTSSAVPGALRRLTEQLATADDARRAQTTPIPGSVRHTVVQEVSRRLAERHGLRFGEPTHHPHIRSLVSEPTWLLMASGDPAVSSGTGPRSGSRTVPMSQLLPILDDVERL